MLLCMMYTLQVQPATAVHVDPAATFQPVVAVVANGEKVFADKSV